MDGNHASKSPIYPSSDRLHQHQTPALNVTASEADPLLPSFSPSYYSHGHASTQVLRVPVVVERRIRVLDSHLSSTYGKSSMMWRGLMLNQRGWTAAKGCDIKDKNGCLTMCLTSLRTPVT